VGMERPRRKPLPASSSFRSETYQLLSSPSHDQNHSVFWTQGPTRYLSSGPYEHAQRSWTMVEDSGQESWIAPPYPPSRGKLLQTGYLRNVPWVGVGSLLVVSCSTITSAIILVVSNGDAVTSWRVAPSVVLAILSAISTACLSFLLQAALMCRGGGKCLKARL
jgi:hypothetical protein